MTIPLLWFLAAWFAIIGLALIVSLITTSLALRFSFKGGSALLLCALFLSVGAGIVLGAGSLLATTNWNQSFTFLGTDTGTLLFP